MTVAAMQPYFFPHIGYFQLIGSVDLFIVGDNIQYVKERWMNRNRRLQNGKVTWSSLPLRRDSHLLDVRDRELVVDFKRQKMLNQIGTVYLRAPYSLLQHSMSTWASLRV